MNISGEHLEKVVSCIAKKIEEAIYKLDGFGMDRDFSLYLIEEEMRDIMNIEDETVRLDEMNSIIEDGIDVSRILNRVTWREQVNGE